MSLNLRQYCKTALRGLGIRLVKMARCEKIFCQPNLPKWLNLLYNKAVLILIIMAGMRMTALAAGLGAAMAGGPNEANAETDILFELNNGEKVAVNVDGVPNANVLVGNTIEKAEACIGGGEARDLCVAQAISTLTRAQLDSVVRETHQRLQPLEEAIGLTAEELIQEPVFCDYAPDDTSQQVCAANTEAVQLAALDVQIAQARERRIAAETRVAAKEDHLEGNETRVETKEDVLENSESSNAERRQDLEVANTVLAALRRVTE